MGKKYFVDSYDNYNELINTDACAWFANGTKPEELSDDAILNEFSSEWKEGLMEEDDARKKSMEMDDFHGYFSTEDLCEGVREKIKRLIDEDIENKKITVDFLGGEMGEMGGNYMLANVEVDGEEIELYAEVHLTDEYIDGNGEYMESEFDDYSYPILKEEIINQAKKNGINPENLKFYWD